MTTATKSQEQTEIVNRYASKYNEDRLDELDEVLHPAFTIYGALGADGPLDFDGYQETAEGLRTAFPDLRFGPHQGLSRVYADDTTAHRARFVGTHDGPLLGIQPTGNEVDIEWPFFARWEDRKIIEKWDHPDVLTLLQQIGVVPADLSDLAP